MATGWYNKGNKGESYRHSLAAKGIKSKSILTSSVPYVSRGRWTKESIGDSIVFTNSKDPSLTYEIHLYEEYDEDFQGDDVRYYCFPAKDGKGIPSSPDFCETKSEALKLAKEYISNFEHPTKG